jgi:hypothetical protein
MFHWICPECGREIPPKLKECPACDPQPASVDHASETLVNGAPEVVPAAQTVANATADAVVTPAPEAVVNTAPEAATEKPAPAENLAAEKPDAAAAPVADSPAPALKEPPTPVESSVEVANTVAGPAGTIEPADPVRRTTTEQAVTDQAGANEAATVEPETTRPPVEAAEVVAAGHPDSSDDRLPQPVAESLASAPDSPVAVAASAHPGPAAAQPEGPEAVPSAPSTVESSGQQEPSTEPTNSVVAGPAELPADLLATRLLAIPPRAVGQPDAAGPEFPERQAQLPLSPTPSPDPARDPLLALAEQIREAQAQAVSQSGAGPDLSENVQVAQTEHPQGSTVVPLATAPVDVAQADVAPQVAAPSEAAPVPPPIPAEPVPAAITPTVAVTPEPPSRALPEETPTEEIFLPAVLARLAASIGASEPRPSAPTAPEPAAASNGSGSPRSASTEHATEHAAETVTQWSPASAPGPAPVSRTADPLVLSSGRIESISRTDSVGLLEPISPIESNLASAHAHIDSEHARPKQLALLAEASPLALLAPPEAAPVPLEPEVLQAPPEPVAATAETVTQLAPPQLPIAGPASPDDSSSGKPPSGSWLQLAPLQDYSAATAHSMQPVPLATKILTADSGPRMTLPGPTLPPDLARLQNANVVTVIGDAARTGKFRMPGWAVSFLVMLTLLVIGVGVVFYFLPVAHSSAETQVPAVEGHGNTSQPAPPPVEPQPAAHPLAQFVEVTGFRIVVDFNKKSEIHYLVVNHSGSDLSDVTVYVTLRTANAKPGQPPLCRFSFRAPNLGPFESKEMTSSIEKLSRSITLPEWQDLRPEVQIAQ